MTGWKMTGLRTLQRQPLYMRNSYSMRMMNMYVMANVPARWTRVPMAYLWQQPTGISPVLLSCRWIQILDTEHSRTSLP